MSDRPGRWVAVARVGEIPPGEGRSLAAGSCRVAVFNDGGELLAIDDSCPHQGASLGQGLLHQGQVICPWHSYIFDLRTGHCPIGEEVATYPTRCANGTIEVQIPAEAVSRA